MNSQENISKKKIRKATRRCNKDVSAEVVGNRGILNVHQVKVLEKIMQRKKDQEMNNNNKLGSVSSLQSNGGSTSGVLNKSKKCTRINKTQGEASGNNPGTIITKNTKNNTSPPNTRSRPNTRNGNYRNKVSPNVKKEDKTINVRRDNVVQVRNNMHIAANKKTLNNKRRRRNQAEERITKLRNSLEKDKIDVNKSHTEDDHTDLTTATVNIQIESKLKGFVIPRKRNDTNLPNVNNLDSVSTRRVLDSSRDVVDITPPKEKGTSWVDIPLQLDNNLNDGTEIWNKTATHSLSKRRNQNLSFNRVVEVYSSNDGTDIWNKNIPHSVTKCWDQDVDEAKTVNEPSPSHSLPSHNITSLKRKRDDSNTRETITSVDVHSHSHKVKAEDNLANCTTEEKKFTRRKANQAERRLHKLQTSLILDKRSAVNETPSAGSPKRLKNDNTPTGTDTSLKSFNEVIVDEDMEEGLVNDLNDSQYDPSLDTLSPKYCNEEMAMDWETIQYELQEIKTILTCTNDDPGKRIRTSRDQNRITVIVLDTNILLKHLQTINDIITGDNEHLQINIPWVVFNELDKLKTCHKSSHVDVLARKAIKFLYTNLTNGKLCGQPLSLANNHLYPCNGADDEILNCCLQLIQDFHVILLTDDINLCNKALVNNVIVSTYVKFLNVYWDQFNIKKSSTNTRDGEIGKVEFMPVSKLDSGYKMDLLYEKIEKLIVEDLSIILKAEMMSKYNDLWMKIILLQPPWNIKSLLKCFVKHWIAVFGDILPRDAMKTITNLQPLVGDTVSRDFDKLEKIYKNSIELFTYFLLTDHKYLATKSLESLQKIQIQIKSVGKCTSLQDLRTKNNTDNCLTDEPKLDSSVVIHSSNVTNAFNCIVESLGKFCCSIANNLGICHNLNFSNDNSLPLNSLVSQADGVGNQLQILISCLSTLLSIQHDNITSESTQVEILSGLNALLPVLSDTLQGIGKSDISFNLDELRGAFIEKRNIFDEGCKSLLMLHNLLLECSVKYASLQST